MRPGKLTDNPFINLFNGGFWDKCLNVNWSLSMDDVGEKIKPVRSGILREVHILLPIYKSERFFILRIIAL